MDETQMRSLLDEAVSRGATADQVRELHGRLQGQTQIAQNPNAPSALSSLNTSMQNAASFGLAGPIEGLANAAAGKLKGYFNGQDTSFSDLYNQGRERYAQNLAAGEKENPISSGIGTVAGALGSIPVGSAIKSAPTIMGKVANYITGNTIPGMALGTASGFGNTNGDIDNQIKGAGIGMGIGGVLGTALPATLSLGGKALSPLMQLFNKNTEAVTPDATRIAAKNIMDLMRRDNLDVANMPLDQNLLQSGGNAATGRAEAISTRGSQGADMLKKYADQQSLQLPNDLSEALGAPFAERNYPALLDAIKEKARTEAGPAYDAAYDAVTKINDPQINQTLDRAVAAGDWNVLASEARKLAAYEGRKLGNLDATGTIRSFSTQDLDYMTRALRNLGQGTEGMGAFGNRTPLGAMRANNAGAIRQRLKEINPLFGEATQQYAGDIAMHDAAQLGKSANLMTNNWKQAVADYNALGPAEQQAWRVGQAENLQTMIANNPRTALSRMNSPQFSKVMKNFYSPEEYNALMGTVKQLAKEGEQTTQITRNSRTAMRGVQQMDDKADENLLMEQFLARGAKGTAKDFITQQVLNRFVNTPVRQNADRMVAQTLLSSPFEMAGREAGGNVPPAISAALSNNPFLQEVLLKRLQGPRFMYSAPISNLMLSTGAQQ